LQIRPIAYGVDFYGDALVTTEAEVKEHGERVKAFRRASLEGWGWAIAHGAEIADRLAARAGMSASKERFRAEMDVVRGLVLADATGRVAETNAAARALVGAAADLPLSADSPLAQALRGGAPVPSTTVSMVDPEGRTRTVLSSAVPLQSPETQAVVGGVAVLAD